MKIKNRAWLAPSECAVLLYLADGSSFSWAAQKLMVSENTARGYAKRAYRKLGVHNKYEAIALHRKHPPTPSRSCDRIGTIRAPKAAC